MDQGTRGGRTAVGVAPMAVAAMLLSLAVARPIATKISLYKNIHAASVFLERSGEEAKFGTW